MPWLLQNLSASRWACPAMLAAEDSSLNTHQVMAATIVHEARVDGITAVAITSVTPLADTLALQKDISVLQTYQSILINHPKNV